jgi:hypothetical protein
VRFEIEKKNRNQLIVIISLLVSFILLLPILYNFKLVLGIGYYHNNNDFNNDLVGGTGGLNINFDLVLTIDDRYTGTVNFDTISSGSVDQIGIISISYTIYKDSQILVPYSNSFDPPINVFQRTHNNLNCEKDNIIKCQGTATVKFLVGTVEQEEVINFELRIIITLSSVEIEYTWDVIIVWLQIFEYIVIFALILILVKIIRRIKFDKQYTEDMKKEDEEFFDNIRKNIEREKTL